MRRADPLTRRLLLVPLRLAARLAPRALQRWAGWPIAGLLYLLLRGPRRAVRRNLEVVGGGRLSEGDARRIARRPFHPYGQYLLDYMALPDLRDQKVAWQVSRVDGEDHIAAGLEAGRGAILTAPHFGLWELGGAYLASRGYGVHVMTALEPDSRVRRIREEMREALGIETITLEPADGAFGLIPLLAALRRNRLVALLGDRVESGATIQVDFFGQSTPFPIGPALLGRASGAPIVPVFVTLIKDWTYEVSAEKGIDVPRTGDRERDTREATQLLARCFETRIAGHPEQWYNFFDFWPGDRASPPDRGPKRL